MGKKNIKKIAIQLSKEVVKPPVAKESLNPIFLFDRIDKDGPYAFDLDKSYFDHKDFLEKMINYSRMTWNEIRRQQHDYAKSKHHYIGSEAISKEAQKRLKVMKLWDFSEDLFSFAFNNKLRIIGLKESDGFHVLWYDVNHEVCPSRKKHT